MAQATSVGRWLFVRRAKVPARCNAPADVCGLRRSVRTVAALDVGARRVRSAKAKVRRRRLKRSRCAYRRAWRPDRECAFRARVKADGWVRRPAIFTSLRTLDRTSTSRAKATIFM